MGIGNGVSVDGSYGRSRIAASAKDLMPSVRACLMGAMLIACTSACAGAQPLEEAAAASSTAGPWSHRLSALESRAAAPDSQLKSADETKALIESLAELIQSMSPSDEAQHYPRLANLRWRVIAFDALHQNTVEGEASSKDLPDPLALRLRSLRDAHPSPLSTDKSHADAWLLGELAKRADEIDDRDVKGLIAKANGVLAALPDTQDGSGSLHELFSLLDYYEGVRGASNPTIGERRDQVGELAVNQDSREYQLWALDQMQLFKAELKEAKGRGAVDKQMWSREEASSVPDLMAERLLRIDPRHLDMPVLNLYRDTFDSGWKVLSDDAHDLLPCVAVTSVLMPKRRLGQPVPAKPAGALLRQNSQWAQACPR